MKLFSTYTHGLLDYAVGILLLLLPDIFGFAPVGGTAVSVARTIGGLILLQALATDYELGACRIISMKAHLAADYLISLVLTISPWLFGFFHNAPYVWMPHFLIGLLIFLTALGTETHSDFRYRQDFRHRHVNKKYRHVS